MKDWTKALEAKRTTRRLAAIREIWDRVQFFLESEEPPITSLTVDHIRIGSTGKLDVHVRGELDFWPDERDLADELKLKELIATLLEKSSSSRQKTRSTIKANTT